jgi:diguanylate cyclase (GGDEF)-like protein
MADTDYRAFLYLSEDNFGQELRAFLVEKGCSVVLDESPARSLTKERLTGFHLAFVHVTTENQGIHLCRELRNLYFERPLEIIALGYREDRSAIRRALTEGADDFMLLPTDENEVELKLLAAVLRLKQQSFLYDEREFYRRAVKQEEELSSKVLDQNVQLRRKYDEIEDEYRALEEANRDLERVARFDVLSGLLNRLSLFGMIEVEIDRARRSSTSLCGIMIDIDHFKHINDTLGHGCGDKVIARLGDLLRNSVRKYDHVGRYGGEEFFVVLPATDLEHARQFAERLREEVAESKVECEKDPAVRFTISMGIAEYRGQSRDEWIAQADEAMYLAKERGRNRTEVYKASQF